MLKHHERAVTLIEGLFATIIIALGIAAGAVLLTTLRDGLVKDQTASQVMEISRAAEKYLRGYWDYLEHVGSGGELDAVFRNLWVDDLGTPRHYIKKITYEEIAAFLSRGTALQVAPCVASETSCGTCLKTPLGGLFVPIIVRTYAGAHMEVAHLIIFAVRKTSDSERSSGEWDALQKEIEQRLPYGKISQNELNALFENNETPANSFHPCATRLQGDGFAPWLFFHTPIRAIRPVRPPTTP